MHVVVRPGVGGERGRRSGVGKPTLSDTFRHGNDTRTTPKRRAKDGVRREERCALASIKLRLMLVGTRARGRDAPATREERGRVAFATSYCCYSLVKERA